MPRRAGRPASPVARALPAAVGRRPATVARPGRRNGMRGRDGEANRRAGARVGAAGHRPARHAACRPGRLRAGRPFRPARRRTPGATSRLCERDRRPAIATGSVVHSGACIVMCVDMAGIPAAAQADPTCRAQAPRVRRDEGWSTPAIACRGADSTALRLGPAPSSQAGSARRDAVRSRSDHAIAGLPGVPPHPWGRLIRIGSSQVNYFEAPRP